MGNRAVGERLTTLVSPPAQRLAAALLLLSPHLPLLFMGEEYGEEQPFQFFCSFEGEDLIEAVRQGRKREFEAFHAQGAEAPDPQSPSTFERSRLTWRWNDLPHKAGLRRLYRDLLEARRSWPALRNYAERSATLHRGSDGPVVLELVRGGSKPEAGTTVQVFCNLTGLGQTLPVKEVTALLFSSEAGCYDGGRRPASDPTQLLPFECIALGPPNWRTYGGR